eukprot:14501761-Alexandrium_andersonii.AAC.1
MSASLVGSEMCIRDSPQPDARKPTATGGVEEDANGNQCDVSQGPSSSPPCLLYTSDAADDM